MTVKTKKITLTLKFTKTISKDEEEEFADEKGEITSESLFKYTKEHP